MSLFTDPTDPKVAAYIDSIRKAVESDMDKSYVTQQRDEMLVGTALWLNEFQHEMGSILAVLHYMGKDMLVEEYLVPATVQIVRGLARALVDFDVIHSTPELLEDLGNL